MNSENYFQLLQKKMYFINGMDIKPENFFVILPKSGQLNDSFW